MIRIITSKTLAALPAEAALVPELHRTVKGSTQAQQETEAADTRSVAGLSRREIVREHLGHVLAVPSPANHSRSSP
jgi:hypothetical protein